MKPNQPRRRRRFVTVFLGLLAFIILVPLAFVCLPGHKLRLESLFRLPPVEAIDFTRLKKTTKPNQYLVCPTGLCAETPDLVARVYPVTASKLATTWQSIVLVEANVTERTRDQAMLKMDYVQRTAKIRYPDLITVQFLDRPDGQSTLAIYSRSVYGHSDMGVNKARITSWLAKLDEALTSLN
jgi:hypothetical protein